MRSLCFHSAGIWAIVAVSGCQSAHQGSMVPAGPSFISPNGTASVASPFQQTYVEVRPLQPQENEKILPVKQGSSPPRILRPSAPKPLKPADGDRSPFQLIAQRDVSSAPKTPARPASDVNEPRLLRFEALSEAQPLGEVISPRKLRTVNEQPPMSDVQPPVRDDASVPPAVGPAGQYPAKSLVKPLAPQGSSLKKPATRVQPLPPLGESAGGFLHRRTLPQKPIPIYPEVPERTD